MIRMSEMMVTLATACCDRCPKQNLMLVIRNDVFMFDHHSSKWDLWERWAKYAGTRAGRA
jgi:hypothetical protein